MKILELFSGYGTASFALKRLNIPFEIIGYSDIDKYANQCFRQNHDRYNHPCDWKVPKGIKPKELGDVRLINPYELEDFDLLTAGFPCQSFSVAGKQLGELDPRGTLFYEIIRIAKVKKPKYMLLENVKGLTSKRFKDTFDKILSELDRIGYKVYWKVLNSKDYGIPQSRARVWFVCFRKDIDTKTFKFPKPIELKIFIKDILETEVDKKYYLSEKLQARFLKYLEDKEVQKIIDNKGKQTGRNDGCSFTLGANERNWGSNQAISVKENLVYDKPQGKFTPEVYEVNEENNLERPSYVQFQNGHHSEAHRVYNSEGISQTIKPFGLKVYDKEIKSVQLDVSGKGYKSQQDRLYYDDGVMCCIPNCRTENKVNIIETENPKISNCSAREAKFQENISPTLCSRDYKDPKIVNIGKLRRLTPKECFRLMGFLNDEINISNLSDTQCYKLAGNGQVVTMVELIFKEMFKDELNGKI